MAKHAASVLLSAEEERVLLQWVRAVTSEQRTVERARAILLASQGQSNRQIALALNTRPARISKWRTRFGKHRLEGLVDGFRSGRPRKYDLTTDRRILRQLVKALQNGYRCQFIRAQDRFDEMEASLADRSTRKLGNRLARLDGILIDEFGYLNLKPEQSNTFFKLMEERYHRHSPIIPTNLIYDEWQNFLGNKPMVEALLSRVRHYCHTGTIDGPSLRPPQG